MSVRASQPSILPRPRCVRYTGEFSAGHRVIGWFWDVLLSLSEDQALQFLKFYAGADAVPAAGFRRVALLPACGGRVLRAAAFTVCVLWLRL